MSITIEQLVSNEIHYCASQLINELSKKASDHGDWDIELINIQQGPHDYESAARDEGFDSIDDHPVADSWEDICEYENITPYEDDVLEHWIVSDWLADKLIAKGETVDKDFMGLVIWGRTTSGQHISQDYVIQQIHEELVK